MFSIIEAAIEFQLTGALPQFGNLMLCPPSADAVKERNIILFTKASLRTRSVAKCAGALASVKPMTKDW